MAPLAGRPPFATDEPDSFYETPRASQPRLRQPAPADPNKRTSAYDLYDNYLEGDKTKLAAPSNRNSGIGAMLLNMGDDSDSDDDDEDYRRRPTNPPAPAPGVSTSPSKHAALVSATSAASSRPSQPQTTPENRQIPPQMRQTNVQQPSASQQQHIMRGPAPPGQQQQQMGQTQQHNPQPIAAPRPGYPAPIAALNLARPEMAAGPGGRQPMQQQPPPMMQQQRGAPPPIHIPNAFDPPRQNAFNIPVPGSPAPSTPHPLLPPVTPITPAFIRPSKSPAPGTVSNVSFAEGVATPRKPIMRGNSEETLLPSRGEKGDDFWRRFSMVVKEENKKPYPMKESSWLRKTRDGGERHSRWVWVIGMFLVVCIAGGIAAGVYLTRNNAPHQAPTAIGGSADNVATAASTTASASLSKGAKPNSSSSSSLHVSPTNTVARRAYGYGYEFTGRDDGEDVDGWAAAVQPKPTPAPGAAAVKGNVSSSFVKRHKKRRLDGAVVAW